MSPEAAVWVALIGALVVVGALGKKPVRKAIGGLMSKDKKGRTVLVVWPAKKGKGGKR